MTKTFILATLSICTIFNANAFDTNVLINNKESLSRHIKGSENRSIESWLSGHPLKDTIKDNSKTILSIAMNNFMKQDALCDVNLSSQLKEQATRFRLIDGPSEFKTFVAYLRQSNMIDDLFYQNIINSENLDLALERASARVTVRPLITKTKKTKEYDLEKIYAGFKQWPDEVSRCSIDTYKQLAINLTWKNANSRDRLLNKLNYMAYDQGIISKEVYKKLEAMRHEEALDWSVYAKGYLDIVSNAKDKLSPSGRAQMDPAEGSTVYVERKEKLTRRGRLYRNFDSTQVMMLAEIILKTAKRMDSKRVSIDFQYDDTEDSEHETYVLSPMEKYRLSIKMLRKDMGEVMRSDLFTNTVIEYEDLVTAAYETGLIKSEELDLILKFEEFWNPKDPKWKTYLGFTFSILGTATFYLPPPWNIIGAIALIVTQTQVLKKKKKADADDNWNVVI